MTITIELTPEVEAALKEAAAQQGDPPEQYLKRLVEAQLAPALAQTPRTLQQDEVAEGEPLMLDQALAGLLEAAENLEGAPVPRRGKRKALAEILEQKYRKQGFRL